MRTVIMALALILLASAAGTYWFNHPSRPFDARVIWQNDQVTLMRGSGWTDGEATRLREYAAVGCPALIKLYGEPSQKRTLVLNRVEDNSSDVHTTFQKDGDRMVVATEDATNLSASVLEYPSLMIHELAHQWHGRYVVSFSTPVRKVSRITISAPFHDAYEEGMAEAVSAMVAKELDWTQDRTHKIDIGPGCNQAQLSANEVNEGLPALYPLRLQLAAWAFAEWEEDHPGFLKNLNQKLYAEPVARQPISFQGNLGPLGDAVTPGFSRWIASQHIFRYPVKTGTFLWMIGDGHKLAAGIYIRDKTGKETPAIGEPVQVKLNSLHGSQSVLFTTNQGGMFHTDFIPPLTFYTATATWKGKSTTFRF